MVLASRMGVCEAFLIAEKYQMNRHDFPVVVIWNRNTISLEKDPHAFKNA